MRNISKIGLLVFIVVLSISTTASAGIKFDISATAGKITETVSGWLETAKKQMDQSVTLQTMITYGKGAMETAKALKEMKDDTIGAVQGAVNETVAAANSVKDTAAGAVGDVVGDTVGDINKGVGSVTNNAKVQEAQKLLALKEEKTSIEAAQEEASAAAQEAYNAKIKLADENIAKLRAEQAKGGDYQAQIASYEQQKSDYKKSLDDELLSIKQRYQSQLIGIEEQMSDLRTKAAEEAGKAAADKLKSLKGKEDDGAAELNETIAKNFLKEDAAESSENIVALKAYRNFIAMQDSVQAFNSALVIKKTRYSDNESADTTADKVTMMDGATSAIGMDTKLKIENIKSLLKYNDLLLQDMKMKTATELAKISKYKLDDYSKNVTEFNLDDYAFNKKDTKKKILEIAKGAKEGGLEGAVNAATNDSGSGASSNSRGNPANTGTNVHDELMRARAGSGHYEGTDSAGPTEDATPVDVDEELERARAGG